VNVSGVSSVFKNSFVTYSNEAKMKWLEVPSELLDTYGAVSQEVAVAMAEGVARVSETTIGVGITGIAGPEGGSVEKPVGTVCICVKIGDALSVQTYHFNGNRKKIRDYSAQYALLMLYRLLVGV
jgi:nicotinamide-nucleotide amidase